MHKKVRQIHNLKVGRDAVYLVMAEKDPEGLKRRGGVGEAKRKPRKKPFRSLVSNAPMESAYCGLTIPLLGSLIFMQQSF